MSFHATAFIFFLILRADGITLANHSAFFLNHF